jgi:hypothetical protein
MDDVLTGRLLLDCEQELEETLKQTGETEENIKKIRPRADERDVAAARDWVKGKTAEGAIVALKTDNLVLSRIVRRNIRSLKTTKTGTGIDTRYPDKGIAWCVMRIEQLISNQNNFKKANKGTDEEPSYVNFPPMPWEAGYVKPAAKEPETKSGI